MNSGHTKLADIVYGRANGFELLLDLYLPKAPIRAVPIIVYIHGGGWSGLDKTWCPYAMRMLDQEYAVASINYRLSNLAAFPAQLHDCKAAVRWLRAHAGEYHLDGDHIGAWGDSAGGHLSAMLGVTGNHPEMEGESGTPGVSSAVQAVCDWYGPGDLEHLGNPSDPDWQDAKSWVGCFIGGAPASNRDRLKAASPVTYVSKDAAPFLIMHGDHDTSVLLSQSIYLYEALWLAGADVELYVVRGGDHLSYEHRQTDIPWQAPEVNRLVDAFFYRTLRCAKT
ncbi:MAG: alpha/beta hydrolase fold domain-containing protein [Anaerolineae bacterium]